MHPNTQGYVSVTQGYVSVVIATKNAERTLARCLASLHGQAQLLETIVVDNFSSDRTVEVAERCGARVYTRGFERSEQRNYGVARARGDFVLLLDADMSLSPGSVAECARVLEENDAVVLSEVSYGEGFWARCKWLERRCYEDEPSVEAARGFRLKGLLALGGYDEELFAFEDWDLHNRCVAAGFAVGRADPGKALIKHDEGRLRLRETVRKKGYYGGSLQRYVDKHPLLAKRQIGVVPRLALFLRHWSLGIRYPHLALGVTVMKALEGLAGFAAAARRASNDGAAESRSTTNPVRPDPKPNTKPRRTDA